MNTHNLKQWLGQPVVDFQLDTDPNEDTRNSIFRFRTDRDSETPIQKTLEHFFSFGSSAKADALVIRFPGPFWDNEKLFDEFAQYLIDHAANLPHLRHLFFGDFIYEESDISYSPQTDGAKLIEAFPALETFVIRGSEIEFSPVRSICLQSLSIQIGGLHSSIFEQLHQCVFPDLEKLHIMTGDDNYGWDGNVEDIHQFLKNFPFPSVKNLGLLDTVQGDELPNAILSSGNLSQLDTLDLSWGTISDEGARVMINTGKLSELKGLIIERHYVSEPVQEELKNAGCSKVTLSGYEGDEPIEDRYVAVGE